MNLKKLTLKKVFPYILLIGAGWAIFASLMLTYDTIRIDQNPNYVPSCSLNPVLSCGTVITAAGDKIFGLPYPIYGILVYGILFSMALGMIAGAKFKKWYWQAFEVGIILGTVGAYGLFFKSVYTIHALCPYCLSVDFVTTIMLWYTTLYVVDQGYFSTKNETLKKIAKFGRKHHLDLLILWFVLVVIFILNHFWYYYKNHL
jgi:uncharacterized membrane protein